MNRNYFILCVMFVMIACNNNKSRTAGWTRKEEENWLKLCVSEVGDKHPKPKDYCSCVLEKIEKKYPTYAEANKYGTEEEGKKFGLDCYNGSSDTEIGGVDGEKKVTGEWSTEDKDSWVRQCLKSLEKRTFSDEAKKRYCDCVGVKLEQRYADFNEMNMKGTYDEGVELGKQCVGALTAEN